MRHFRQAFALITLFCLFFELCEPSTNFIRSPVASQKQEKVLKIKFHNETSKDDQDPAPNSASSLKNFETHAAQIAVSFSFDFNTSIVPTYTVLFKDAFHGDYSESIFQPPKTA